MMRKIFAIVLSVLIVLALPGCVMIEFEETPTPDTQQLVFVESKMVTVGDDELVGVFFDYTNGSEETCMPCDDFDVKAFQNGVELQVWVYSQKVDGAIQCDMSVQSGTTARVVWTFEPDDDSTVSIEVSDGQKLSFDITK